MGGSRFLPLSIPYLDDVERTLISRCLDENYISHIGPLVKIFEEKFAEYIGVSQAAAVINGTAALHLALRIANVKPNTLVFAPSLTFIAPVNAIAYCGASPIFLDIDPNTLAVSPDALESYLLQYCEINDKGECIHKLTCQVIQGIVVVHLYGFVADLPSILEIAQRYHLTVIEDAAEAVGCFLRGQHLGTWGDFGCFSFNGNKVMTTGGGGMLTARLPNHVELAKHLATQAKSHPQLFIHDAIGYNYRLSNLHAAIGVGQLEKLPMMLKRKAQIFEYYRNSFQNLRDRVELLDPLNSTQDYQSNYWMALLKMKAEDTDAFVQWMFDHQIEARKLWSLNHTLPMYMHAPRGPLSNTEALVSQLVAIPTWQGLTDSEVDYIIQTVHEFFSS